MNNKHKFKEEEPTLASKIFGAVFGLGSVAVILFVMLTIMRWIGIP